MSLDTTRNKIVNIFYLASVLFAFLFIASNYNNFRFGFNLKKNSGLSPYPSYRKCFALQDKIYKLIHDEYPGWSITVLDEDRYINVDINGLEPRIPASNVKLISTAYALEKLGTEFKLKTRLVKRIDGVLEIWGEGDPDLDLSDINTLSKKASLFLKKRVKFNKEPKIILYEEPFEDWWPDTWNRFDRLEPYGSPITRLAITSNSQNRSIQKPIERFRNSFVKAIKSYDGIIPSLENQIHRETSFILTGRTTLKVIESSPMVSLLSLANSESHNFTAEILMRMAAKSWKPNIASKRLYNWLINKKIPVDNFVLVDGSGLSRKNRLTSVGISSLLWMMDQEKLSHFYKSSMSVIGLRGTLSNFNTDSNIYGNFYGKTGTLTGVRAISGILVTPSSKKYVSIIANNISSPDLKISSMLALIYRFNQCPL